MRYRACLAFLVVGCAPAFAQTASSAQEPAAALGTTQAAGTSTDAVIIAGQWDHVVAAQSGGTGSVDWLRAAANGSTYTAGVAVFSMAGSQWTVGTAGLAVHPRERIILHAQARMGGGQTTGTRFTYRAYEGGVAYRTSTRLYLNFGDEYLHIGETRGHLLKPGFAFAPTTHFTTEVTYAHSAGGNLDTAYEAGRLAWTVRAVILIGGLAVGATAPEVFNVGIGGAALAKHLREGFFGVRIPLSRGELTVVWSDLDVDATQKRTVAASVKYPLRTR